LTVVAICPRSASPADSGEAAPKSPGAAQPCGIPATHPLWIDYADALVPFWRIFARPGVIAAGSSPSVMPELRAAGAATVYFDLRMKERVGTPATPFDLQTVVDQSNDRVDRAVARTGCPTPIIAENELLSADLAKSGSSSKAARYEQNVLTMVKTMASRGAHPYLLIQGKTAVKTSAPSWWRRVARHATIVVEVYRSARAIHSLGPIAGGRRLRQVLRESIKKLTSVGIPRSRIGVMLGFQIGGRTGRDGLEPATAWYRVVKWQALAAARVASETSIDSVWSWGWGGGTTAVDLEKETAACVYLWTRSRSLCNALTLAGPSFNSSRAESRPKLPRKTRCLVGRKRLTATQVAALARVTGSPSRALSLLYARAVESRKARVTRASVLAAEHAIVALRFSGSMRAYRRALARAGASRAVAQAIVSDELRERRISASLPVRAPSSRKIRRYYRRHADQLVRLVQVRPAASWLGGRTRGYALASLSPPALFGIETGSESSLRTVLHRFRVTPVAAATTLGRVPLAAVRGAIRTALVASERRRAFTLWSVREQRIELRRTSCTGDRMPPVRPADGSRYLPFLSF
jgi:hypothetical protein